MSDTKDTDYLLDLVQSHFGPASIAIAERIIAGGKADAKRVAELEATLREVYAYAGVTPEAEHRYKFAYHIRNITKKALR